jgi:tetratricopeptide (TPR) repeat protein
LQAGDVLIFGSDGRDDVLLGLRDDGGRIINEDETLFLEHVRRGAGELEPIYRSLLETGALTDDLALLRVSYLEDAPLDAADPREQADALTREARTQFRAGDYAAAAERLGRAVDLNPGDLRALALLSQAAKLSGDLPRAALEGERVRLRAPEHSSNLLNLADVYRRMGDSGRALKLLAEAEALGEAAAAATLAKLRDLLARS